MFKKKSEEEEAFPKRKKKGLGVVGLFRLLISLCMLAVLLGAFFSAYKHFSGVDPLKIDSQASVKNILFSDKMYRLVTGVLTVDPRVSLSRLQALIRGEEIKTDSNSVSLPIHTKNSTPLFKFAVVTDSHNDNNNLARALKTAKSSGVDFVIGMGDYSDVGTEEELQKAKQQFEESGLPFYLTAGDHDLWDARNRNLPASANFSKVFGSPYMSFTHQGVRFLLLYNSDNYLGVDGVEMRWLESELEQMKQLHYKTKFIFAGIPLFHPSSDHVMGKTNIKLKSQAEQLINLFADAQISEVFAGDAHLYSRFTEPKSNLKMTVVGAITSSRNLQTPRFCLVDVYSDGGYNIEDVELK
jgi:hypothetical protein